MASSSKPVLSKLTKEELLKTLAIGRAEIKDMLQANLHRRDVLQEQVNQQRASIETNSKLIKSYKQDLDDMTKENEGFQSTIARLSRQIYLESLSRYSMADRIDTLQQELNPPGRRNR